MKSDCTVISKEKKLEDWCSRFLTGDPLISTVIKAHE